MSSLLKLLRNMPLEPALLDKSGGYWRLPHDLRSWQPLIQHTLAVASLPVNASPHGMVSHFRGGAPTRASLPPPPPHPTLPQA